MTSVSEKFKKQKAEKKSAEKAREEERHQEYLGRVSNMIEGMLDGLDQKIEAEFNKAAQSTIAYGPTLKSEIDLGFWSGQTEVNDIEKFVDLPAFKRLQEECASRGIAYEFNKERSRNMIDDLNMFLQLTIHLSMTQEEAESRPQHGQYVKLM